jgi:hypothetical protein
MIHAEVVGVDYQQACRGRIAQALLQSLFLDRWFFDSRVLHGLGAALRQADNKEQDCKIYSLFHDHGLALHHIPSNSAELLRFTKTRQESF